MDRNPVRIQEEIEAAREEFEASKLACQATYNRAKAADRDLTDREASEFDHNAAVARAAKSRIDDFKNELERTQNNLRTQVMSRHPSAVILGNTYNGDNRPKQVLPTNGVYPDDNQRRYSPIHRIGKLRAFRDEQTALDCGRWYQAILAIENRTRNLKAEQHCEAVGLYIVNAGYEGSGPAGGYTVPAPLATTIIEVRERVGVARQVCNVIPTSSDTITVPKRASGLTVYVVNEMQTITDSDKGWSSVSLGVKKRACLSYLSQELTDDSIINVVDNLVSEQAYALALQEDDELINGTGASTYGGITGLLSSIGSAGVNTTPSNMNLWSEITLADMANTVGKLPDRYHIYGPSWICSHAFFNSVMVRLALAAGGATLTEIMSGTPTTRTFMGYPVHMTSKMPVATADSTKCALFGAFDQGVILADRGAPRMSRSDEFKFAEDLVSLKATSRYDMAVHDAGDSSNAGAYVALSTNAA